MRDTPDSTLALYRRLLAARRASPALSLGSFAWLPAPDGVLCYRRSSPDDERVVAVNFTGEPARVPLPAGRWDVEISTHGEAGGAGRLIDLRGDEAVILTRS